MMLLMILSNAGGIAGAGTNIPLMLLFFDLDMARAVPLSVCVAFTSVVIRFLINLKASHPNDEKRTIINYDIV